MKIKNKKIKKPPLFSLIFGVPLAVLWFSSSPQPVQRMREREHWMHMSATAISASNAPAVFM